MGESPLFPPQYEEADEAKQEILLVLRRCPDQFDYQCSRWTLAMLIETLDWLRITTEGGMSQVLRRLRISYKRGRDYVHSPDPHYEEKRDLIKQIWQQVSTTRELNELLYMDEFTCYRQPTLARAYEASGHGQPLAHRSHMSNTSFRIVATMNAFSGQVIYRQRSHTDVSCLAGFWNDIRAAYPHAKNIYVVLDNWPVHFHPDVLAPLKSQKFPWPPKLPGNWPTEPSYQVTHDLLPIQLLCLPTYASWLNPIEKLWRWLQQDILHLHRYSDDWQKLKERVAEFLGQFQHGSTSLLRYTGLLPK